MGVRLLRLALLGFKSFADPVELVFDRGITAIVGPNGSGKSNLAEAIAWVLGEQAGSAVRSRRADDVIFAGGPDRPSLGMAEVTLTLEQDGDELGVPFREVSVTRRVFRDGETQYLINGSRARLRDVLRIAAILRADWIITRQGSVDDVLDQRPAERRHYLEHAAGLSALRLRQAEARQQLAEAEQHAQRLDDLLRELEPHVHALGEAAQRAREALAVRASLREALLQLSAARWRRAREEEAKARRELGRLESALRAAEADRAALAAELERVEQQQATVLAQRDQLRELRTERAAQAATAQYRTQLARERIAALGRQLDALAHDVEQLEREMRETEQELEHADTSWQATVHALRATEAALREREAAAVQRTRELSALREQLHRIEHELAERVTERERLARTRAALLATQEAYRAELQRAEAAYAARLQERQRLDQERVRLDEQRAALAADVQTLRVEVERQAAQTERAQQELERCVEVVRELEREDALVRGRLETLTNALTGDLVASAARAVLAAAREGKLSGIVGTLGTLLHVPAELETAIEAALGGHLSDIVVEQWSDAEAAIAFLKATKAGRATFHPLDTIRSLPAGRRPLVAREPGVIGVAADLVEAPPALVPIVESLLGRVLVADDLATVRRLLPQLPPGWVIVTREGELARPTGSVTGGATRGRERGFLSLVRQRRAFAARQERLAASLEEARRQFLAARDAVERARRSLESVRDQLRTQETKLVQLDHEWVQLVRSIQRLDDALAREAESIAAVRAALARDDEQARALHEQEDALHAALDDLEHQRAQVADAIARLDTPDPEREQLLEQIATLRERERAGARERSQLAQRLGELRQRLAALHARWDELRAEHTQFLAEAERSDAEAKRLALEAAELETEERARTVEIERLAEQAKALRTESARAEQRLRQLAQESAAARAALERAERALHSLVEQAAWELAEGSLDAELVERLEQASRAQQDPPERWERRVAELRRRWQELSRFGEAAIAQYESERERYESLRAQLEDVRGTTQALRKLLADLDREVERGLVRSLRALDRAFADTFAELFGGGRARLVARNGAGSIEGVDLVVQPAGKRVRSVQQLSGGERALTAIALRFALLELDPLPFCVLDEVDAALDEANVARFRGVLERLAERTQFLVITHNRVTIEAAGTLYGVTMGEDGVSRVVSLRLADYACG